MHTRLLRLILVTLATAGAALAVAACGGSAPPAPSPSPSATVHPVVIPSPTAGSAVAAAQAGDLRQFLAVVAAAGLQGQLSETGSWTLFAPDEAALATLKLSDLLTNLPQLREIVGYHLVPGVNINLDTVEDGQSFTTAEGAPLTITYDGGARLVNDATIVSGLTGGSWTVYVIDEILTPPSAEASPAVPAP